jgi:general secretion pathway protein C
MVYLGLGPDEEYDDYATQGDLADSGVEPVRPVGRPAPVRPAPATPTSRIAAQAPIYSTPPDLAEGTSVRPVPITGQDPSKPRVRAVPQRSSARAHLVVPTTFGMVQEVADKFKAGQAVAEGVVLHSLAPRQARLSATAQGPVTLTLDMPPLSPP